MTPSLEKLAYESNGQKNELAIQSQSSQSQTKMIENLNPILAELNKKETVIQKSTHKKKENSRSNFQI
jgi:hypothetical protein